MRPLDEARREVLSAVVRQPSESVSVFEARNRILSAPVVAQQSVPSFANSAMDGFAVRAADITQAPVELEIVEDVPAGSVPSVPVGIGQATRIMTGAPVPDGADSIVMVEETRSDESTVTILAVPVLGDHVRPAGSDVEAGATILGQGVRLTPRHLASAASVVGHLEVAKLPTVAFMSTGDEVVPPDTEVLQPGTIRDTNRVLLNSMLEELSIPHVDLGIIDDDLDSLRSAYERAAAEADVIVSTGGVSMGDHDYVKQILGDLGTVDFWKVAMQPAKPFAFGHVAGTPLFGLPGNPVSTFVAFEQFLRPALLHMMGAAHTLRPRITGTIGEDVSTNSEKEVFMRVILARDGRDLVALKSGGQGSNVLSALAAAEAFAVVPVGVGSLSAGDDVTLEMFRWTEDR